MVVILQVSLLLLWASLAAFVVINTQRFLNFLRPGITVDSRRLLFWKLQGILHLIGAVTFLVDLVWDHVSGT
jgi:hypothetical protein